MEKYDYSIIAALALIAALTLAIAQKWYKGGSSEVVAFLSMYGLFFILMLPAYWLIKTIFN